jgi:hypothetical protein
MDDGGAVLDLNDFFYFVQVVDRGGFTAAGPEAANSEVGPEPSNPTAGNEPWGEVAQPHITTFRHDGCRR